MVVLRVNCSWTHQKWQQTIASHLPDHVQPSWNVMAHGDARGGSERGNWGMVWVASTLHTTSEHGASSITTADAHTWAASSRLNWRPRRFKWTRPFRRKTKFGFCACAITFQTQSTTLHIPLCCPTHTLHPLLLLLLPLSLAPCLTQFTHLDLLDPRALTSRGLFTSF